VISAAVEAEIGKLGYHVKRITGAGQFATAIAAQGITPTAGR